MLRIALRVRYDHRGTLRGALAIVLLTILLLAALALSPAHATAPARAIVPSSPSAVDTIAFPRQYYLSKTTHTGAEAPDACADGFHFASIWEIADPSALRYNTSLGRTSPDSGKGPPTLIPILSATIPARGWVRTGSTSGSGASPGAANCEAWASDADAHRGTTVNLPSDWEGDTQHVGVWQAESLACNLSTRVWCVQDDNAFRIFLPLVLRH